MGAESAGERSTRNSTVDEVVIVPNVFGEVERQVDDPVGVLGYCLELVYNCEEQLEFLTLGIEVGLEGDEGVDLGRQGGEDSCG